ncbi:hypothetical protein C5167_032792 [Papaver somniferum]|uniref:Uncharacterized protein n=1 Tax=Papaver somniferum TaxID=3469 RepID=A0A4Y7KCG2_PAPSO|nr:hypothetical protein C5167_032792 [Papaver somniferum]
MLRDFNNEKFHLGSMGVDAKPVTKTLDVYICQPDSKNEETDRKAKLAPQQSEQPVRCRPLIEANCNYFKIY